MILAALLSRSNILCSIGKSKEVRRGSEVVIGAPVSGVRVVVEKCATHIPCIGSDHACRPLDRPRLQVEREDRVDVVVRGGYSGIAGVSDAGRGRIVVTGS